MLGSLTGHFKARFLTGLFIVVPLVLTIAAIVSFFNVIDRLLGDPLKGLVGEAIPGLGFLVSLAIVFLVGIVATTVVGKRLLDLGERLLLKIPIFKNVYTAVKQLIDAFNPANKTAFKKFVMVEYPRPGVYSFGFLTDRSTIRRPDGSVDPVLTVFIPTNHLYIGEIVLFRSSEVLDPGISIEEGIRLVLSGGTATPSDLNARSLFPSDAMAGAGTPTGR